MIPTPGSAQVQAIGYVRQTQTLLVEFRGGSLYGYDRVPVEIFLEMYESKSPGSFLNKHIKGAFPYQRLYEVPATQEEIAS
jgi:hypothetical protein